MALAQAGLVGGEAASEQWIDFHAATGARSCLIEFVSNLASVTERIALEILATVVDAEDNDAISRFVHGMGNDGAALVMGNAQAREDVWAGDPSGNVARPRQVATMALV